MFNSFVFFIILAMLIAVGIILIAVVFTTRKEAKKAQKICLFAALALVVVMIWLFALTLFDGTQKYLVLERFDEAVVVQNLDDGSTTAINVDKNSKLEAGDVTIGKSEKVFIDGSSLSKAYMTYGDNDTSVTSS